MDNDTTDKPEEKEDQFGEDHPEHQGPELLEIRRLVCPVCGDKWLHHFYKKYDPCFIDCSTCGTMFVWIHEDQKLFAFDEPWEEFPPETFQVVG